MSNVLNDYIKLEKTMRPRATEGHLTLEELMLYQELRYRIEVLGTMRTFAKTAPTTNDVTVLSRHYQLVDAFIQCLGMERKIGAPADEKMKGMRAAGTDSYQKITNSSRKTFSSFRPKGPDDYKTNLNSMITAILSIWVPYRNTYININL